jgi:hypothetical protein
MLRHVRSLLGVLALLVLTFAVVQAEPRTPPVPLRLQVGAFDPLTTRLPALAGAPAAEDAPYQIVQFHTPPTEAQAAQAEALGATLLGYLPDQAYVVRIAPADLPKLRSLPGVRWIGPYQPAYKLAPALTGGPSIAAAHPLVLTVVSFPGEPPEALAALLRNLGAQIAELSATPVGVVAQATLPAGALTALSQAALVSWVEPYVAPQLANAPGRRIMNAERVWANNGLFGAGQVVAISDSGLDVQRGPNDVASADFAGRLTRAFAPSEMRPDSPTCAAKTNWTDLNGHGTHVAGSVLGSGANSGSDAVAGQFTGSEAGIAPRARFVFMAMNTDGGPGIQCVPANGNYIAFGYQNGARISSNSWGGNAGGVYTFNDSVVDDYIWRNRDYLVLFAAGNSGPNAGTIGSPGSAKNILSVGASENDRPDRGALSDNPNTMASFSSRGPTADGRIKPDIAAPGTNILSVLGSEAGGLNPAAPGSRYAFSSGTSMATPLTAGAATLAREWLVTQRGVANPSAALLKALLIHGAFQLPGAATPNPNSGWGRVDLGNTIEASYAVFEDDQAGLRTGDNRTFTIEVAGATPNGTLFVGSAQPPATDLVFSAERPMQSALPPGATNSGAFTGLAVPGYDAAPAHQPIGDLSAQPGKPIASDPSVALPAITAARPLTSVAAGIEPQDFLQSMVGGGDFEDPAWTNTWSQIWLGEGIPLRTSQPDQVISGQYSIWLGGSPSNDLIAYPLSFPETIDTRFPSTLSFKVRQVNQDRGFDTFCVAIVDASGYPINSSTGELLSCSDSLPSGVQQITIAFTAVERAALAGQTGYLYLFTVGDGLLPHMSAFVDEIELKIDFPPVSLSALPAAGPAGTTFLLTGAHHIPYGPIQVCLSSCDPAANVITTVFADARGEALAYITSNAETEPGTYTFEMRNAAGRIGRTPFTILGERTPTLSISPSSGPGGTEFQVGGANFLPNDTAIAVRVNGEALGTVSSNAAGAVEFRIVTRSTTPAGTYRVLVEDQAGRAAETSYQVTVADSGSPQMSVTPPAGPPGSQFTFTGSGFTAGGTVNFTLAGSPIGQVNTDGAGGFSVTLDTNPAITPGSYTLEAVQGERRASATFQITANDAPITGNGLGVTLVWTDPPGSPGAAQALVNNLNLRVEGPNDAVWLGNGGTTADSRNNVETVRIGQPEPGTYRIIVEAAGVNGVYGAQPFALLATTGQNSTSSLATSPLPDNTIYLPLMRSRPR